MRLTCLKQEEIRRTALNVFKPKHRFLTILPILSNLCFVNIFFYLLCHPFVTESYIHLHRHKSYVIFNLARGLAFSSRGRWNQKMKQGISSQLVLNVGLLS